MNPGYPVLLRLEGRRCVVVGGGSVAARKARDLLEASAAVTVISPALAPSLQALADAGQITVVRAIYAPGVLANLRPFLVFAATDSRSVNQQVAAEARSIHALADVVDAGGEADLSSMGTIRRGALTIAISTAGGSPALAAHLKARLAAVIGPEYGTLASWLGELRPVVREQVRSEGSRKALWQAMIDSPALDLLRQGDEAAARRVIDQLLAEALAR